MLIVGVHWKVGKKNVDGSRVKERFDTAGHCLVSSLHMAVSKELDEFLRALFISYKKQKLVQETELRQGCSLSYQLVQNILRVYADSSTFLLSVATARSDH